MQRFIQFNDEKTDPAFAMELTDLVKMLTKDPEYEAEFRVHSYLDVAQKKVYVSRFWDHRPYAITQLGSKSDVYLRALGNYNFSDAAAASRFVKDVQRSPIASFSKQFWVLAEDMRIEEACKHARPGMKKAFLTRRATYTRYFESQLQVNSDKHWQADALLPAIYVMLNSPTPLYIFPDISPQLTDAMPAVQRQLENLYDASSTSDVSQICLAVTSILEEILPGDMVNEYFHFPESVAVAEDGLDYRDLKRNDALANDDEAKSSRENDETVFKEEMRTWHRETSEPGKTFMQFSLEQGTKTPILGGEAREGDAEDQALAMAQGSAKMSDAHQFLQSETAELQTEAAGRRSESYGHENRFAFAVMTGSSKPSIQEIANYQHYRSEVEPYKKRLKRVMERALEHKQLEKRTRLQKGRLSKKLIPLITEEEPRLFYKKDDISKDINAVFSLMVDCSQSMYDKMRETKLGVTLFHESLKAVRVPHIITGFWEDANAATENSQPNYFKTVVSFSDSLLERTGPEILQLQPEEDNRDGYAIRVMTELLGNRQESQKFLLIFSDGEPAAYGYSQNGIVDTHEAVLAARKKGIEVINIFLGEGEIEESQRNVMKSIYGSHSIMVEHISSLAETIFPILQKLLLKTMR